MDIINELSETSSALYVLSTLMRKPLLLEDTQYVLTPDDFTQPLQQMLFTSIFNMEKQGANSLTPQNIDLYLKTQPTVYQYYSNNKGYEWLLQTYKLTEEDSSGQFGYYYSRLKKFTILRELVKSGIDISDYYNVSDNILDRGVEDEKLDKISAEEIINSVREKLVRIEDSNVGKSVRLCQTAKEGMRELIASFNDRPDVGLPLDGEYINSACRGARLGKFYLYSASTGAGKTRHLMDNALSLSMPYIVNHKIMARDGYEKVLFVTLEQDAQELQPMILAHISGVEEEKIKTHNFTPQEYEDIELALKIIDAYGDNMLIEVMPDPSTAAIGVCLTKHILQDKIQYIFYDYISSTTGLLNEFRDLKIREDVALRLAATKLKEICTTYNVFIYSGTQTNRGVEERQVRTENCIEGSKAIANKIDFGIVSVKLLPGTEEMESVQAIIDQGHFPYRPNQVLDIYKNRGGRATAIKIFRYFDYGTCRGYDLFVTDTDYQAYISNDGQPLSKAPASKYERVCSTIEEIGGEANG